jgi:hypothetical protein
MKKDGFKDMMNGLAFKSQSRIALRCYKNDKKYNREKAYNKVN